MRPRLKAAEYMLVLMSIVMPRCASMRPRLKAAEYRWVSVRCSRRMQGFNEAAAQSRGIHASPTIVPPHLPRASMRPRLKAAEYIKARDEASAIIQLQ